MQHSLSVVVVLCNVRRQSCYWQAVIEENVIRTKNSWTMDVPAANTWSSRTAHALQRLAEGPPYEQRLRQLQLAKPWMQRIQNGARMFVEAQEWVNKTMSRGSMKVRIEDGADTVTTEMDWPFVMFPHLPWAFVFPHLFPWADFAVDNDRYYDVEYDMYCESEGAWDNEDQEYRFVSPEEFREWRLKLAPIRPYTIEPGEGRALQARVIAQCDRCRFPRT